jgi:predicted nucleic-acid-binding protein
MLAADTNVLIRFLTQDDEDQAARARSLIKRQEVWIAKTVLLETAWVLRRTYAFDQPRVTTTLRSLAGLPGIKIEDAVSVARAFDLAVAGLDFADALHLVSMGNAEAFVTFDKKFAAKAGKLAPVTAL